MKNIILLFQFFSKIPISKKSYEIKDDFYKAMTFLPIVGLIIGFLMYIIYIVLNPFMDRYIVSLLVVLFETIITGGLHLDGLGDTFDGIYSYRYKEKILEILKDSRMGTNGILAIIFVLLLKIFLYANLNNLLFIIHILIVSRFIIVYYSYSSKYARKEGMGGFFISKVKFYQVVITFLMVIIPLVVTVQKMALISFVLTLLIMILIRNNMSRKIDGITGDILGASAELSEVIYLFFIIFTQGVK